MQCPATYATIERMADRAHTKNSRYLETPSGPILNLGAVAREVIVEWLDERGIGPTSREAADRLHMPPTTLNQIVKGERRMTVEKLSYPVSAIANGDPGAFFERHEVMRPESERRDRELRALAASFSADELGAVLRQLGELRRLGPDVWHAYGALVDALLKAAGPGR